jgi:hypothetical protein
LGSLDVANRRRIMSLNRLHGGRPGIWSVAVIGAVGSITVGLLFLFDGKGAVSSPAYSPARHVLTGLGIEHAEAMHVWGGVFVLVGLVAVWPLTIPADLIRRGSFLVPVALLWLMWSVMFLAYAIAHGGLGAIAAVIWAMTAANLLAAAFTMFTHARRGD